MLTLCTAIGIAVDITPSHVRPCFGPDTWRIGRICTWAYRPLTDLGRGQNAHCIESASECIILIIVPYNNCSLHFDNVSQTTGGSYTASLTYNIGEILNYRQYDTNFCLWRSRRGPGCIWVTGLWDAAASSCFMWDSYWHTISKTTSSMTIQFVTRYLELMERPYSSEATPWWPPFCL